jgi:hypothetical protein
VLSPSRPNLHIQEWAAPQQWGHNHGPGGEMGAFSTLPGPVSRSRVLLCSVATHSYVITSRQYCLPGQRTTTTWSAEPSPGHYHSPDDNRSQPRWVR